nr:D-tyrosyl-tRNA(Tyr) deacylase [uncultured Gammaproteobacteria bacterium]BAL57267.1 D-tyrosyl-tRNA(Tyr) deacylase [uncultured Gammaproteobacteria bacterium]
MIAVLQRVSQAKVEVLGKIVGEIGLGILVLVAVERQDTERQAERMAKRLLGYRVFADPQGKMNLSVMDVGGGVLLVPQFTLAADTRKGLRPSFTPAAEPATGKRLFEYLVEAVRRRYPKIATGHFGADMQVHLTNAGPVTFILRATPDE